jgi:hypothetical protein
VPEFVEEPVENAEETVIGSDEFNDKYERLAALIRAMEEEEEDETEE